MVNSIRFLINVAHDAQGKRSKFERLQSTGFEEAGKDTADYLRSKASPFAKVATDAAFGTGFHERPMPWNNDPLSFRAKNAGVTKKYGYGEYLAENVIPIPLQMAATEVWKNQGVSAATSQDWMRALAVAVISGGTGTHLSPDTSLNYKQKTASNPQQ
jgi:hypothetical protein